MRGNFDADIAGGAGAVVDDDLLADSSSVSLGCRMRPTKSDAPPGANGTIMRTGRDG